MSCLPLRVCAPPSLLLCRRVVYGAVLWDDYAYHLRGGLLSLLARRSLDALC